MATPHSSLDLSLDQALAVIAAARRKASNKAP